MPRCVAGACLAPRRVVVCGPGAAMSNAGVLRPGWREQRVRNVFFVVAGAKVSIFTLAGVQQRARRTRVYIRHRSVPLLSLRGPGGLPHATLHHGTTRLSRPVDEHLEHHQRVHAGGEGVGYHHRVAPALLLGGEHARGAARGHEDLRRGAELAGGLGLHVRVDLRRAAEDEHRGGAVVKVLEDVARRYCDDHGGEGVPRDVRE